MTHPTDAAGRRGFTLLEVVVALALLAGGFLAVAQLMAVAARAAHLSRATTLATNLATENLERLQSLAWGCTGEGTPVGDLVLSASGALAADTAGFVDYLDGEGAAVGSGFSPPSGAMFTRRWSIEPDEERVPPRRLVVRVVVLRREASSTRNVGGASAWIETTRLVAVRTRRPD